MASKAKTLRKAAACFAITKLELYFIAGTVMIGLTNNCTTERFLFVCEADRLEEMNLKERTL